MDTLSGFARLALQLVLLVVILQSCSSSKVCKRQRLKFCAFSGVRKTPIKNLVDQSSQKQVRRDKRYKDFEALSATGCSNLVRPFACSIYAPVCLETFGSLPPCKSLCQKVRDSCKRYIAMNKKRKSRGQIHSCFISIIHFYESVILI